MDQSKADSLSDELVARKVRSGDKDMYQVLMERYQPALLRYVGSIIGGDQEIAADVVQETFIKAFLNLNSFNVKLKFSSWLYRIAHNETINYIKKHHREYVVDETWWEQVPALDFELGKAFDKKLMKLKLAVYLAELPLKYREPLLLYYFDRHSYQEISDVLRIPIATVGTRIKRAKDQLKAILRREGLDHDWEA